MHANLRKVLLAATMIGAAPSAFADVITDWNEKAVAFVTPRMPPAAGQRVVAIMQVAMFDAVNSIERRYRPYLIQVRADAATTAERMPSLASASVSPVSASEAISRDTVKPIPATVPAPLMA